MDKIYLHELNNERESVTWKDYIKDYNVKKYSGFVTWKAYITNYTKWTMREDPSCGKTSITYYTN